MLKHLKQLHGIRRLFPYLKTKRPTVLLIFFLSVIDAGLSLLPIQIIAAVVDLLSTGRSAFSPILGTSLTLHLVFFGVVYASKHAVSLAYGHTNTMLSTGIIESLHDAPAVEFDHVTISCSEHKQLHDLCFTAAPHQLVVLAGESGSGKSTILNTLLGNQPTMGGRILVDHADMTGQLDRLRSSVSVAFQASYLFDRSIADNVAYASDAPDGQRIGEALRASGLDGLVRERGTDFTVGSKGKFLSGGEQRRVALSRALYKNAPLVLLDEPTSELDPETSRVIIEQILRLKESATVIAASHDAALIEQADVVVTL